jgi:hypothetical protein
MLERQVPPEAEHGEVVPQPQNGQMILAVLSVRGEVIKVPVPGYTKDDPTLTWVGQLVAVGSGGKTLIVNPASGTYSPIDIESEAAIRAARTRGQNLADDRKNVGDIVRRLGANEGTARPN